MSTVTSRKRLRAAVLLVMLVGADVVRAALGTGDLVKVVFHQVELCPAIDGGAVITKMKVSVLGAHERRIGAEVIGLEGTGSRVGEIGSGVGKDDVVSYLHVDAASERVANGDAHRIVGHGVVVDEGSRFPIARVDSLAGIADDVVVEAVVSS